MNDTASARPWSALQAILVGGLLASVGDFVAAMAIYSISWEVVGHAIAAGWLGKEAATASGVGGALLGAVSHTGILLLAAAIYVVASRKLGVLARQWIAFGLLFGTAVYLTMNFVVVPLSAAGGGEVHALDPTLKNALNYASHLLLVGLPIAWAASKARNR